MLSTTLPIAAFSTCLWLVASAAALEPWPTGPGIEIGQVGVVGHLPEEYEPSGAVWHPGRSRLLLVDDDGRVSEMTADGDSLVCWTVAGDLEGIALPDPLGNIAYLGLEHPDSVLEFDLTTGMLTGNSWDLTPWMTGLFNKGLEALTVANGLVFAGLQATGEIFVFELFAGDSVAHRNTIAPPMGFDDCSGLHFDEQTSTLFAIYDTADYLFEMSTDGVVYRAYDLIGDHQEGITLIGGNAPGATTIFIAEDSEEVWRYTGYPIDWPVTTGAPHGVHTNAIAGVQVFPNPFRDTVQVSAASRNDMPMRWQVYDALGRSVLQLPNTRGVDRTHTTTWNGRDARGRSVPPGVYFLQGRSPYGTHTAKLIRSR